MLSFMCQPDWGMGAAQTLGQTSFWVCLWQCSCWDWHLHWQNESSRWPSQRWWAPSNQLASLNRTKKVTLPQVRELFCLTAFELRHFAFSFFFFFLLLCSNCNISSSWALSLSAFRMELGHWFPCVSSLLTIDLGTCWPPSSQRPIPYNKSTSICLRFIASLSLENPD